MFLSRRAAPVVDLFGFCCGVVDGDDDAAKVAIRFGAASGCATAFGGGALGPVVVALFVDSRLLSLCVFVVVGLG